MKKEKNNFTYKMRFMEEIIEEGYVPAPEELEKIYVMSEDKNPHIRAKVTRVLSLRPMKKTEEILRNMTYDKNRYVRGAAAKHLAHGCEMETLSRLKELMSSQNSLIRYCAIDSHFDVWVNMFGYNKTSMDKYLEDIESLYHNEKNIFLMMLYERQRCFAGKEEALTRLRKALQGEISDDYRIRNAALDKIVSLRTYANRDKINRMLHEAYHTVSDEYGLKSEIKKYLEQPEWPRVLILDRGNSRLSQLLEYEAFLDKFFLKFFALSAGTDPDEAIDAGLAAFLKKEKEYDINRYQCPERIRILKEFDYIVPIGIVLNPDDYPFHRIIPLFENVDENRIDWDEGKQMLKAVCKYIYGRIDDAPDFEEIEKVRAMIREFVEGDI